MTEERATDSRMAAHGRTIQRTLHIATERPRVFRALMDPAALSRWLFATVTLTAEEGSSYSFEWRDSRLPATAQGEVLELVLSGFMEADGVTSSATFELTDDPAGGTTLQFAHRGLPEAREWAPRFE